MFDAGIDPRRVVADPGIGFGKMLDHNTDLLSAGRGILPDERMPLMWGVSRKRMFADLLGREDSRERLAGSLGIAAKAPSKGVDIIRVHDVEAHADLYASMRAVE